MGIPYEVWTNTRANYDVVHMFDAVAYAYVPDEIRTKLDMKAVKGIFIGIDPGRKCYKVYDPGSKRVIQTRDVTFVYDTSEAHEILADTTPVATYDGGISVEVPTIRPVDIQLEKTSTPVHLLNKH